MAAKKHPRTMIWKGTEGDKPHPFKYKTEEGESTKTWTDTPEDPLLYDDNGDGANTPAGGWPLDYKYDEDYTVLVHNYDWTGKAVSIYQEFKPTGVDEDPEAEWHNVSGPIVEWQQKAHEFKAGETGRTDFNG